MRDCLNHSKEQNVYKITVLDYESSVTYVQEGRDLSPTICRLMERMAVSNFLVGDLLSFLGAAIAHCQHPRQDMMFDDFAGGPNFAFKVDVTYFQD